MKKSLQNTSVFLSLMLVGYGVCVATAQAQQAAGTGMNYEMRLSAIEDELRDTNGRMEKIEFSLRRLEQSLQRLQSDTEGRLSKLEFPPAAAPAPVPTAAATPPATTPEPAQPPSGKLGALKMQDGKVTGGAVDPQASPLPNTPPDYGLTAQEQYDRAFGLLRQADYEEAEGAFKQFIDKNPKDKLIDNAKYWYGETLYVRAKYSESAVAFADAYQQNTHGSKAPDSLLKLAMSLEGLKKPDDACTTLGELKAKYPNAPAALKARADEERSKLKCAK